MNDLLQKKNTSAFFRLGNARMCARVFFCCLLLLSALPLFFGCGRRFPPSRATGEVAVHFVDVGQGDAILIESGEKTVLIDTGDSETAHTDALLDYLGERKIARIDCLILTHPDEDHIGGAVRLLEAFPVSLCLLPDAVSDTDTFRNTLDALDENGVFTAEAKAGDIYPVADGVSLRILSPRAGSDADLNDQSAVLRLTVGTRHFLFMGDAGEEVERTLLEEYAREELSADVLKLSHHGAADATTDAFLSAVLPRYAIVSCGAGNRYGHPDLGVLYRCVSHGAEIYRTDEMGCIVFLTDGKELSVFTER